MILCDDHRLAARRRRRVHRQPLLAGPRLVDERNGRVPASSSLHIDAAAVVQPRPASIPRSRASPRMSCHLLWFLSLAAEQGWRVDAYDDAGQRVLRAQRAGPARDDAVTLRPCAWCSAAHRRPRDARWKRCTTGPTRPASIVRRCAPRCAASPFMSRDRDAMILATSAGRASSTSRRLRLGRHAVRLDRADHPLHPGVLRRRPAGPERPRRELRDPASGCDADARRADVAAAALRRAGAACPPDTLPRASTT